MDSSTAPTTKDSFVQTLLSASWQAFIICVMRVFTIPWTIWTGAARRLASMRATSKSNQLPTDTEFPVFEWLKASWDGFILFAPFIGLIASIFAASNTYGNGFPVFFMGLVMSYFSIILVSLTKEGLVLMLSIALNVEKISNKPGLPQEA